MTTVGLVAVRQELLPMDIAPVPVDIVAQEDHKLQAVPAAGVKERAERLGREAQASILEEEAAADTTEVR